MHGNKIINDSLTRFGRLVLNSILRVSKQSLQLSASVNAARISSVVYGRYKMAIWWHRWLNNNATSVESQTKRKRVLSYYPTFNDKIRRCRRIVKINDRYDVKIKMMSSMKRFDVIFIGPSIKHLVGLFVFKRRIYCAIYILSNKAKH